MKSTTEHLRLDENRSVQQDWKCWDPYYLSERQWGTVREDYSPHGNAWEYFPHDHARSRASRWGEDGLAGISDDQSRLCLSLALWNGKDPILKERLFGLTNSEGNHGEDAKELYYYFDATPTPPFHFAGCAPHRSLHRHYYRHFASRPRAARGVARRSSGLAHDRGSCARECAMALQ